jgi:hypothetical protein
MPNINDEISKMPELSEAQFHTVWTEAVGLEGYNKRLFRQVYENLVKNGKIIEPAKPMTRPILKNFFYEDAFYVNLLDLLTHLNISNILVLPDGWKISIELAVIEPIFKVDAEYMSRMLYDCNDERFPENPSTSLDKTIDFAIEQSIDFHKLALLLPKFHYPSGKHEVITKKDLIDFFKPVE